MALQFWKPGTLGPGSTLDRVSANDGDVVPSAPSTGYLSIQAQRERLPIFKHSPSVYPRFALSPLRVFTFLRN